MPPTIIRYGSAVNFDQFDVLAFDLDHTIARYRVQPLMALVYRCLKNTLIEQFGYEAASLSKPYDPNLFQKGIITDFHTGDTIKLDHTGRISVAYHGTRRLSMEDIAAKYGESRLWPGFHMLKERRRHDSFFVFMTYFDGPCVGLFMQLVDAVDAQATSPSGTRPGDSPVAALPPGTQYDGVAIPPRYLHLRRDFIQTFDYIFDNVSAFETGRGGFFAAIKERPLDYLVRRPTLKRKLLDIRAKAKHLLLLVTNSHIHFARATMEATLGDDWDNCFDAVVFNSAKPTFFAKLQSFHAVDWAKGVDGGTLSNSSMMFSPGSLNAGTGASMATKGNATAFQKIFDAEKALRLERDKAESSIPLTRPRTINVLVHFTVDGDVESVEEVADTSSPQAQALIDASSPSRTGPSNAAARRTGESLLAQQTSHPRNTAGKAEVIYFGDYIHGDVVPAVVDAGWSAVAVVEELECSAPQASALHAGGGYITPSEEFPPCEDNFTPDTDGSCFWGSFFSASAEDPGTRSYFCEALSTYSVLAITDVEHALGHLA